ncbi:MAG: DnaJ domain-containing protein [Mariprofundaceae bacterium]|nr:DnaJ domain-containing protein [Mariprofundaceae bacterium]
MEWPYLTLDIAENATDEQVRQAYVQKVQQYPPEKNGKRFSAIQQAYSLVNSKETRSALKLFGLPNGDENSIADLFPEPDEEMVIIPMCIWLKELK